MELAPHLLAGVASFRRYFDARVCAHELYFSSNVCIHTRRYRQEGAKRQKSLRSPWHRKRKKEKKKKISLSEVRNVICGKISRSFSTNEHFKIERKVILWKNLTQFFHKMSFSHNILS